MNRLQREKLKWKCRRGLLELDDPTLWDLLSGRAEPTAERHKELIGWLRAC